MDTEQVKKLLADSKSELNVLSSNRKTINDKIAKLNKIIQECEATLVLIGKYKEIESTWTDFSTLIAEDNLRLMEAFSTPEYQPMINEAVQEAKRQANNVAIDFLKKEEAMGVKERTVNELATLLTEAGETELAERIKLIAINGQIIEKL